jgi:hydrophobic/amphiphilic exporter-1 (mainly G- bacteria), HAE1 family
MPGFSIRNPYFIIVICLTLLVIGVTSLSRMPVDLFPPINLPEVVVATFYTGMPPEDIEYDITDPLERFFTLASGVDHMESRSMLGVSIIRVYFQPGTNADTDVSELSNLALADLKRLPPGTLPPVVLKFDASSLPVALVTVEGKGLNETQLHDYAQFQIRNQIAVVPGAEIPGVFGGIYRQIMVYVDPYKLQSRQLSVMDVVGAVNDSNLILPAGDVKMGPYDYFVYSNSLVDDMDQLGKVPLKVKGNSWVTVNDVGKAEDAHQIQYNIVRIDGQRSAYIPIMKQGGDTNTIAVVDGVRQLIKHLYDIPQQMKTSVVFDQSVYVKEAIRTVLHEGFLGLILTSLMILIFLGSFRATSAVLLSIPYIRAGRVCGAGYDGRDGEHDDPRRNGAGFLARDRQFRHFTREHLSPFGNGGRPHDRRRGRRGGSEPGYIGRHPGGCGRFFPSRFSIWRCQVSLFGAGAGFLFVAAGFVCGGDDGDSFILLAFPEGGASRSEAG